MDEIRRQTALRRNGRWRINNCAHNITDILSCNDNMRHAVLMNGRFGFRLGANTSTTKMLILGGLNTFGRQILQNLNHTTKKKKQYSSYRSK